MNINSYPVELNDCALAEDLRGPSAGGRGERGSPRVIREGAALWAAI